MRVELVPFTGVVYKKKTLFNIWKKKKKKRDQKAKYSLLGCKYNAEYSLSLKYATTNWQH